MSDAFVPTGFGAETFTDRYAIHPDESYAEGSLRLATFVGSVESEVKKWIELFAGVIRPGDMMPGGRIWYGAGRAIAQMLNCYVIPTEDSREGWAKMVGHNIIIAGTGGGLGENYSSVRPRGAKINGMGGFASGAVSIMKVENAALEEIRSGASRRAARMFCLNIDHPDVIEFIHAKMDLNQLNNGNASIFFAFDPLEFFALVDNDADLPLTFRGTVYGHVKARELWEKIIRYALANGEPGILNGFKANEDSNIAYCRELVSTNPCGEQFLQPYSTCCLGALVLPRFIKQSKAKNIRDRIDWERLHHTVTVSVRFLDDVLSSTYYPIPEVRQESFDTRRIGLGIMGLHYFLLRLGLRYSSAEGRALCDKVAMFIKHAAYDASTLIAAEKGPFPLWDAKKAFAGNNFINRLKPSSRSKIKTFGLRNCSVLTIAPTGTTGIVQGVSTGVEPIFAPAYLRRWYKNGERIQTLVVDPLFKEMVLAGEDVSNFESAAEISPEDHLEMQVTWQNHIDNAVSKTINIPQSAYTEDRLDRLYRAYLPKLKGLTVYPEGSRPDAPLTRLSLDEAIKLVKTEESIEEISNDCRTGQCELPGVAKEPS